MCVSQHRGNSEKLKKEAAWPERRGEAGIHLEEDPISYFKRAGKWRREWQYCQGKVRDQRGQLAGGRGSTKRQELMRPSPGQAPNQERVPSHDLPHLYSDSGLHGSAINTAESLRGLMRRVVLPRVKRQRTGRRGDTQRTQKEKPTTLRNKSKL